MKHINTQAIIIKRIDYAEADRIITAITPYNGKLSLLAKGVRRSKSKLAGGLELFSVSDITYIDGKSDLKTVISTQLNKHYRKIVENIEATMMAYEFLKLIDKNTEQSCSEEYFELINNSFMSLDEHTEKSAILQSWFYMRLLSLSGININLDKQATGNNFIESTSYNFSFEDMGFIAHSKGKYNPNHIKFLRLLEKVTKPENLIHVEGSIKLSNDVKSLLNQCVHYL